MRFEFDGAWLWPFHSRMSRDQVRKMLGRFEEFRKAPQEQNTKDAFPDHSLHVYYDDRDGIRGIEFLRRSNLRFLDINPFTPPVCEPVAALDLAGIEHRYAEGCLDCDDIGISFYAPDFMDDENAVAWTLYTEVRSPPITTK
jgi:hypothetical protein